MMFWTGRCPQTMQFRVYKQMQFRVAELLKTNASHLSLSPSDSAKGKRSALSPTAKEREALLQYNVATKRLLRRRPCVYASAKGSAKPFFNITWQRSVAFTNRCSLAKPNCQGKPLGGFPVCFVVGPVCMLLLSTPLGRRAHQTLRLYVRGAADV